MYRIAVVGTGNFGSRLGRYVLDHPDAELVAAMDVDESNLRTAGHTFAIGEENRFSDASRMYDETDLDAVLVTSPPVFHHGQVIEALDRKLHVLCEKPLTTTVADARDIVEHARAGDRQVMVGYQRHLNPGVVRARERYRVGEHEPCFIAGVLTQDWRQFFDDDGNWRTDSSLGGYGHLFSVGTHVVESALWVTGLEPATVTAQMDFADDGQAIDQHAAITVRFADGTLANFGDAARTPTTQERLQIWDDAGSVVLDGRNWDRPRLTVRDEAGDDVTPAIEYASAPSKVDAFITAIREGSEPPATATDGLRVTALMEAAYEAARSGKQVDVQSV